MNQKFLPKFEMFLATIIWGSSFVIIKDTVDVVPPYFLVSVRFLIASVFLGLIFIKRLKYVKLADITVSLFAGLSLAISYWLQTIGLKYTTPSKNAFLSAVYCVLVPFVAWILSKQKPNKYNLIAATLTIIGIALIALQEDFSIGLGDSISLLSGLFFAINIAIIAIYTTDKDPILNSILQFFVIAISSFIMAFIFEPIPKFSTYGQNTILSLVYLAVMCTAVALLISNIGVKHTDASSAALILSLESVFGTIFSIILYHEVITFKMLIGFAVIFLAIIISETKLSFIFKTKTNSK